jgi:hypothetical protein
MAKRTVESLKLAYEKACRTEEITLDDECPGWRAIVGAVSIGERADLHHPFRAWLATKDPTYQAKLNNAVSASVIADAIKVFQAETATRH